MVERNIEPEKDYSDPKYDRFRDMPFSKIYDKDGNDVTRERMLPKVLLECEDCGIPHQGHRGGLRGRGGCDQVQALPEGRRSCNWRCPRCPN